MFTALIILPWTTKICLECLLCCNRSHARSSHYSNHTRVLSGADIQKSRSSGIVMLAGTYGILDKNWLRITNLLLTEREGRTGEYWPEVVTVRTERSEVRTKTTEGQYSLVRPEQARLVSSLLYGTLFLLVKCTSGGLHLKNVRLLHPSLKFRKKIQSF